MPLLLNSVGHSDPGIGEGRFCQDLLNLFSAVSSFL